MLRRTALLVTVSALGLVHPAVAEGPCLYTEYSADDLATILRNEGYGTVQVFDENRITFKADGSSFLLVLYDDGDLQLYYALSGIEITADNVNEWNRTRRLARAYVDTDGVVALEADLSTPAGLNAPIVKGWVRRFVETLAPAYRSFVGRRHRQP